MRWTQESLGRIRAIVMIVIGALILVAYICRVCAARDPRLAWWVRWLRWLQIQHPPAHLDLREG